MSLQRPNLGRRSSLGGASGLVRSPSSTLLSAQNPAESLLSTPHAYSRPPPHSSAAFHHLPTINTHTRASRPMNIASSPSPHVEPPPANAWAGGHTTTLQFAIRAGDKELIRQERSRLARLGINPDEEEERSSDESDRSFSIPVRDTRVYSNNHRRTSLADYTGVNSGYPTLSRGRSGASKSGAGGQPMMQARAPSPSRGRPGVVGVGGGSLTRAPSPGFGRSSARAPSPSRTLPSPQSLGRSGSLGGGGGGLGALRAASRDRNSGAGSTPAAMGSKFGGGGPQPMSSLSRRGSSPGGGLGRGRPSPTSPNSGGPLVVRGFDIPGSPGGARPPSPAGRRFGFGSPSLGGGGGDASSQRVARGRAGSIAGLGAGVGSPPTPEVSPECVRRKRVALSDPCRTRSRRLRCSPVEIWRTCTRVGGGLPRRNGAPSRPGLLVGIARRSQERARSSRLVRRGRVGSLQDGSR